MKKHMNFESDLPHQEEAINSVLSVFNDIKLFPPKEIYSNPIIINDMEIIKENIQKIKSDKKFQGITERPDHKTLVLDVHMETGTGKTYTYTRTIFELNRHFGINKFIIAVPTRAIKAGTVSFLKNESTILHFRDLYGKKINCSVVNSEDSKNKGKKSFPSAINEFMRNDLFDKDNVNILVINQGMINSKTIQEETYDTYIQGRYNNCISALGSVDPVIILDEPHKFKSDNKTWNNLLKFYPQLVIRYGATFEEYFNLIHSLDSISSFNNDLIKGVSVHVEESDYGINEKLTLVDIENKRAKFTIKNDSGNSKTIDVGTGEEIHPEMVGIFIEKMTKTSILLSNGMELNKKDSINPFSYTEILQEKMIRDAVKKHFELEREYMQQTPKIKPMTLFFIDSISSYRNEENPEKESLRIYFDKILESSIKNELELAKDSQYIEFLKKSLEDISLCRGGYFSKDNTGSDEKIEKEITEILHDKETLLDIDNPRRFIFSKWTLKEGWDNPNIFVICKLRGSGSETSKLQEVGRGLRLPVNEYMNRVKDKDYYLHYFVDFEEKDFAKKLIEDINDTSLKKKEVFKSLSEELLKDISNLYNISEDDIFIKLLSEKVIDRSSNFLPNGFDRLKEIYPLIIDNIELKKNKIKNDKDKKTKVKIRQEKYVEFKKLWESINKRVILSYNFYGDKNYLEILKEIIVNVDFEEKGLHKSISTLIKDKSSKSISLEKKYSLQEEIKSINNFTYSEFLLELEKRITTPISMLHEIFIYLYNLKNIDINKYLNITTIRKIDKEYREYIIKNSFKKLKINYTEINSSIHPTTLTNFNGEVLDEVISNSVGVLKSDKKVASNYLYEDFYYDSEIEEKNIAENIEEVIVFAKIPKNSIKIPVAGGGTYSPDFAYVIKYTDKKEELNLVVESKGKDNEQLSSEEEMKIKSAELLFNSLSKENIKIHFSKQVKNQEIQSIIKKIINI